MTVGRSLLRFPDLPDLSHSLKVLVNQIPPGMVTTFGDLARALGDRHAATWVARWFRDAHTGDHPWHRIVRATGEPTGGPEQLRRLEQEGLLSAAHPPLVPLERRFVDFTGAPPLEPLAHWQAAVPQHVFESPMTAPPRFVAGLDVAYGSPHTATVAAVTFDRHAGEIVHHRTARLPVNFPYIPGYLTFRELPALRKGLELLEADGPPVDVILIDGQGKMHPRRAGIAAGFAAVTGRATIGVAKSKLCGRLAGTAAADAPCLVCDGDEPLGYAIVGRASLRPIYVSVGGGITLAEALTLTLSLLRGHRLPEPTHEADRLSKRAARL